jgi:hypothetical protein
VAKDIAAAVDPGTLAIPHGENPIVSCTGKELELLATPDGCCREILVDRRLEDDVPRVEVFARFPQCLVEPAERAAAVAGDEAGGIQPGRFVAHALQHR